MAVAGKIILVTGASRGIGKGIAMACAKEGAAVVVTGRQKSATAARNGFGTLEAAAAEVQAAALHGGSCTAMACDHADDAQVERLIDDIFARYGRLDVLVNNAFAGVDSDSGDLRGNFWDRPLKHWDSFHVVGLRSHYTASVLVARRWVKDASGKGALIVNVGSAAGLGYVFDVAYGVGKAGVDRLTADSAKELKPHGVNVVSLWPGAVATEVVQKNKTEGKLKAESADKFDDMESPEMSGRAVVALAADREVKRWSGRVALVPELAEEYGFTDLDGKIHWGGDNFMKMARQGMNFPPSYWQYPKKKKSVPASKL